MATRVFVEEVPADSRETVIGGRTVLRGKSLAALIEQLGGFAGSLTLITTGETVPVSLEKWRDSDPETTWLALEIISDDVDALPYKLVPRT